MSVYSYTTDSIEVFEDPILYGSLADSPTEIIDGGNILVSATIVENNGYIVNTNTVYPFGTAKVFGSSESSFTRNVPAKVHLIKLSSKITEGVTFTWIGSGTLFEIGGGQERMVAPWVGSSGPLRFVGLSINKTSYNYKEFISTFFTADDYGLISSAVSSYQDFGTTNFVGLNGEENYGFITQNYTQTSFSTSFGIKGSATEIFKPTFGQIGEGIINLTGASKAEFVPSYDSFGLFNVTGGDRYSTTFNNVSVTTIFTIGSKEESAIFNYNNSSTEFYSTDDYQFITSSGSIENYGLINQIANNGEDSYGHIGNLTTAYPYGSIGSIHGVVQVDYRPTFSQVGFGTFIINGDTTTQFIPSYDSFGLFNVTGGDRYSATFNNVSSATIFTIGSKEESAAYNYNVNSVEFYSSEDYEFITSSGSVEDYGSVGSPLDAGIDSYGYIGNLTTAYPFGSIGFIHGVVQVDYRPTFSQVGSGILIVNGNTTSQFIPSYDSFGLFNVTGGDRYSATFNNVSSATIFTIGSKEESATFDYNNSSIEFYLTEDYEFITSSGLVDDYGLITLPLDAGIDSYGYIGNLTTVYPYGSVGTLHGSVVIDYRPSFSQVGKARITIIGTSAAEFVPSYDSFGLFNVTGGDRYSATFNNVSTATIFTLGSKKESALFDYNNSSIEFYSTDDYEFITSSGSTEDYGLITLPLDAGIDSYGYIGNLTTVYPYGSIGSIHGVVLVDYKPSFSQVGKANIRLLGTSEAEFIPSYDSFGLFNVTGGDRYSASFNNVSTTTIFAVGSKKELAKFDYNNSSIEFYSTEDYEFITSSGSTEDYGSVGSPLDAGIDSYGHIGNLTTVYPFGSIGSISGAAVPDFELKFAQTTTGSFKLFGEGTTQFIPSYDSFGLFNVTGGDRYSATFNNVSTATIFTIGSSKKSASYDYNTSSVEFYSVEDYEFITSSGSVEDYGSVGSPLDAGIDSYGYITNTFIQYPFGSIGVFNGTVEESKVFGGYQSTGSLFGLNGTAESVSADPAESTALFTFSGRSIESNTESYAGSGSLFTIGSKKELVIFHYNNSSVVFYSEEDYEFITSSGSTEDYGSVGSPLNAGIDSYGYIFDKHTQYPFGSIGLISGAAVPQFELKFAQTTTGSFKLFGTSETEFTPSYDSFGLFNINGSSRYAFAFNNVSTASIFALGSKKESALFDYNNSSVVFYSEEDYEFIISSGSVEDYGFVALPTVNGEHLYGYIGNLTTVYPFGSIGSISGSVAESFTEGLYTASGSLFGLNGAAESVRANPPESTALFTFSGRSIESNTESYVGTGSLFSVGGLVETVTASENITTLFRISGSVQESFTEGLYTASGSLFGLNGAAESVRANPPESTALFTFSGASTESNTESYVGAGSLFAIGGLVETVTASENITTLFRISGSVEESFAEGLYTASGSLFGFNGASESVTSNPPESTALFTFSGASTESNTESYVGSGFITLSGEKLESTNTNPFFFDDSIRLLRISGSLDESFTEGLYSASGSLFALNGVSESATSNPPESTALFTFSGVSTESNTESYVGIGSLFSVGGLVETVTASENITTLFRISGSVEESFAEGLYTASGSLFALNGAAESVTSNPPESTALFTFSGTLVESNTESYAGSGSLFAISGLVETVTASENITTLFRISGSVAESFTEGLYTASGSLFGLNGAAESVRANPPESTALFTFSGTLVESNTESYVGTGSLFTIGSKKELASFHYNNSSIEFYSTDDYEFITSSGSTEDYGLIVLPLDAGVDSYGYIFNRFTQYPFGSIGSFSGSSVDVLVPAFVESGRGTIKLSGESSNRFVPSYDSFGLFNISGDGRYSSVFNNVSTASIFTIGSKEESATFDYSSNSIVLFSTDDYEFITSSGSTEDYGLITLPLDAGVDSYGYIINTSVAYPFGSIGSFSGQSSQTKSFGAYKSTGSLFGFGGAVESVSVAGEFTTLFTLQGSAIQKNTESYTGSGSLFAIGSKEELSTFHYNNSSIVFYSTDDYEFITSSGSTEDYGFVGSPLDAGVDSYGYIFNSFTQYPFGSIGLFSGDTKESFTEGLYTASGSLFGFGGAVESVGVAEEFTTLFTLQGSAIQKNTESYVGVGNAYISGRLVEKNTESYVGSGITSINGSLEESFTEGLYTGSGSLFAFTGASESVGTNPPESTALFTLQGSAIQKNTESYVGVGNVYVSGALIERNTESYAGSGITSINGFGVESFGNTVQIESGSLFAFTGASESVGANPPESTALFTVFGRSFESFTQATHVGSGGITCYGFMTGMKLTVANAVGGTTFVSGFVSERQQDSYFGSGSLFGYTGSAESKTVDLPEFFGLFTINGSAKESFTESNYNGSGSISIDVFADNIIISSVKVGSGTTTLSGISDTRFVPNWNAFGSLFGYSGSADSKTVDLPEFFGLFTLNGSKFESYSKAPYVGSGSTTFGGELLSEKHTESYVGSGFVYVSGAVSDIKLSYGNFGSGSLFGYTGSAESKTVDLPEFFGLFNVSGSKFESYSKAPYVGSGSYTISGNLVEANTESYVGSGNTSISGHATEIFVPNNIGSGSVFVYGDVIEKQSDSYVGSGSLFTIFGSTESFTVNLQSTTLFSIFGIAIESNTENYVGTGNAAFGSSAKELFTPNNIGSGSLFAINGASESYTVAEISSGLFEISGSKVERSTNAFASDGQLSIISGIVVESHTEVYVASGSASINGASTNKFVQSVVGSGSVYADGFAIEKQTDDYVGFGSLFGFTGVVESVGVSPDDTFGLFNIFGSVVEKNTESYVGFGNTTISGEVRVLFTPNIIGSGSVFVYGTGIEKQTDDYVGSGTLFGFYGAQESVTVNPDENVVLFRFSGTLVERHTESYVGFGLETLSGVARTKYVPNWRGSGSVNITGIGQESHTEIYIGYNELVISGAASEITKIAKYQGYAKIDISGYAIERQSDAYAGSGTLFGVSGSESSVSFNPPESTSLFTFEGSSTSSRTNQYTGFGSIFEFNGSAESVSKSTESTGLFEINGSATVVFPGRFTGSGSLFAIYGSSESITYDLPEFTGLYSVSGYALSSVTSNPPEDTAQYIVSGEVSDVKLSYGNKGFGSLFGINGASVVATPSYITEKIDGIKILGRAKESYARSSYVSSGTQFITGLSENEYRFYEPAFTYVIII